MWKKWRMMMKNNILYLQFVSPVINEYEAIQQISVVHHSLPLLVPAFFGLLTENAFFPSVFAAALPVSVFCVTTYKNSVDKSALSHCSIIQLIIFSIFNKSSSNFSYLEELANALFFMVRECFWQFRFRWNQMDIVFIAPGFSYFRNNFWGNCTNLN